MTDTTEAHQGVAAGRVKSVKGSIVDVSFTTSLPCINQMLLGRMINVFDQPSAASRP